MKQIIDALSITSQVHNWLASSSSPQILHVFDSACNLINERREILSVVTQAVGAGPFNLVIERDIRFAEYLNLATPVSAAVEQLSLGDLIVHFSGAELWDCHPDWKILHAERDTILRQARQLSEAVPRVSRLCGAPQWGQFAGFLSSSIATADIASCVDAAQKLAGLGQGLTPSGDDFMTGAMFAARIIHRREVAEFIAGEIGKAAEPLTTSLSAAWLRAAAKGEAGILWHTLFDALISGEASAIGFHTSNIRSIGATSGADALAGFINTCIAYTKIEDQHVVP